jgi:hypothetical protein
VDGSPAIGIRGTPECDPAGPHWFHERLLRAALLTSSALIDADRPGSKPTAI